MSKLQMIHQLMNCCALLIITLYTDKIYTLEQLTHFYEQLNKKEEHPVLSSIDIKEKLIAKLKRKLIFRKSSYSTSNKSEYVILSEESLVTNCFESVIEVEYQTPCP